MMHSRIEKDIRIVQGEFAVCAEPNTIISTLLGSCVSCCIWDPHAGIGGMNHILNASSKLGGSVENLAGINAMELLINELTKLGADRHALKAKIFGGARMVDGLSDIGDRNSKFVIGFLSAEGIPCEGQSLGGIHARHLRFWPTTGRVIQKMTRSDLAPDLIQPTSPETGNGLEML